MMQSAKNVYRKIRNMIPPGLPRQRLELLFVGWGYRHLFAMPNIGFGKKLSLLWCFLVVDWNIISSHRPYMISLICKEIAQRPAKDNEVMVEAGCYNGGSTIKFSLLCDLMGYKLHVFDSFEGVPDMTEEEKEKHFSRPGDWQSQQYEQVIENVRRYGKVDICEFYKGWFSDTLSNKQFEGPVRIAYTDCDLRRSTEDALQGVVSQLSDDGVIYSQDYHYDEIRELLNDPKTWEAYGKTKFRVSEHSIAMASVRFP